jgi:hypothetical protein
VNQEDLYARIGEVHADAAGANIEHQLIQVLIVHLVDAALSVGVDGWNDYLNRQITEAVERKVHDLLLAEVTKINGT